MTKPLDQVKSELAENKEVWEQIKEYPMYYVSNFGRVKSMFIRGDNNIMKPNPNRGYYSVFLSNGPNSKRKRISIHRLVAEAFYGLPKGMQVNHINGIKNDNRLENLEVVTPKENSQHSYRIGINKNIGQSHYLTKLTNEDVYKIRELRSKGMRNVDIAKIFNISRKTIPNICSGKRWSHLK